MIDKGVTQMTNNVLPVTRQQIDHILETEGYKAAKAAADKANIIWFASAGATKKNK
jgi:hypothetical protein